MSWRDSSIVQFDGFARHARVPLKTRQGQTSMTPALACRATYSKQNPNPPCRLCSFSIRNSRTYFTVPLTLSKQQRRGYSSLQRPTLRWFTGPAISKHWLIASHLTYANWTQEPSSLFASLGPGSACVHIPAYHPSTGLLGLVFRIPGKDYPWVSRWFVFRYLWSSN